MSGEAYELLALLMRYVFVLIGALIVIRSLIWLRRDARAYRKEMRMLPDAGRIGEIVDTATGKAQPLPREGVIGSSRACDIRVGGRNVLRQHARFEFAPGKGLRIIPARRGMTVLNGAQMRGPGYALHGAQLIIGDHALQVRLFVGLDIPTPAAYPEPDAILDAAEEAVPWAEFMDSSPLPYLPEEREAEAAPVERGFEAYEPNPWGEEQGEDDPWTVPEEPQPAPPRRRRRRHE